MNMKIDNGDIQYLTNMSNKLTNIVNKCDTPKKILDAKLIATEISNKISEISKSIQYA